MVVFFLFLFRQARGAQGDMLGFGKSKAKFFIKGKQDVKFADVGGMKEAKQELQEIVDFLKHPDKYQKLGARTPKGAPVSWTFRYLAKTYWQERWLVKPNVPFLSIAGSEFLWRMLVGVGCGPELEIYYLKPPKKMAPAIIFIDEIDRYWPDAGTCRGGMGGHDEARNRLLIKSWLKWMALLLLIA